MIFGRAYPIKAAVFIGRQTFSGAADANISLAATEAQDTAALSLTLTSSINLDATEAQDVAALNVALGSFVNIALDATEAPDVAALNLQTTSSISLAATEAQDTASLFLQTTSSIALSATETQDVANLNLAAFSDVTITLASTEAQDVAVISFVDLGGGTWKGQLFKPKIATTYAKNYPEAKKQEIQRSAKILASAGGQARAAALTPQQRTQIAMKAANTRWK